MTRAEIFDKLLPPDIAQEAKANTKPAPLNRKPSGIKFALITAFDWASSPQGRDYWCKVDNKYFSVKNIDKLKTGNGKSEHTKNA